MKYLSADGKAAIVRTFGVVLCCAFALNALVFTSRVAVPLPIADTWYFIYTFVRDVMDGGFGVADLFVQRGPSDHAQPLQKLLLLASIHFADMDFRVETLWGNLLGVVTFGWLAWYVQRTAGDIKQTVYAALCGCVLFGIGFSLNVSEPYTWYLVSYSWISVAISIAYWLWLGRDAAFGATAAKAVIASFALGMVMDEYAIPIHIALVVSLAIADRSLKSKKALAVFVGGFVGIAASRLLLASMVEKPGNADMLNGSAMALYDVLKQPDAWKLAASPLSDSLAHSTQLAAYLPASRVDEAQWVISLLLFVAHLIFWWRAFFSERRPHRGVLVIAMSFMLLFYASIAGIALSRIPTFGMDYLHQPRYVTSYRLNLFALALMFLAPVRPAAALSARAPSPRRWIPVVGALVALALQVPLSVNAWKSVVYIRAYIDNVAGKMADLGRRPEETIEGGCPPNMVVCNFQPAVRIAIMGTLQENGLSIYSPSFRANNGLEALPVTESRDVMPRKTTLQDESSR